MQRRHRLNPLGTSYPQSEGGPLLAQPQMRRSRAVWTLFGRCRSIWGRRDGTAVKAVAAERKRRRGLRSCDPRSLHPWTSFELNVFGGKQLRGLGQRPCWPGSKAGHYRRLSRKKRQMTGGGGTTPSSTPSWPGAPASRTLTLLIDS